MWQAEIDVDLDAIAYNVTLLRSRTSAGVMTVVKADGYGHGLVPVARTAVAAGAAYLGVATLDEAFALRDAGLTAPVLAWLLPPGLPLAAAVARDIDLSASSPARLAEIIAGARQAGRPARLHLKIDTGLGRGGATPAGWPVLLEAAAKAQADGLVEVTGVWSHFTYADEPAHPTNEAQVAAFRDALDTVARLGLRPTLRHLANSAATLTRPETHYDLVRVGIASYGLTPVPGRDFGLRPAMTARAPVQLVKRVPAGHGVSYGHQYTTSRESTLAVLPVGYADGVPRVVSNRAPVRLAGANRTIAGRVCMDQFVLDCGDDEVREGDPAILFGPGTGGEPTADDWAVAADTINYEIVTRMGSSRMPRRYTGGPAAPAEGADR